MNSKAGQLTSPFFSARKAQDVPWEVWWPASPSFKRLSLLSKGLAISSEAEQVFSHQAQPSPPDA